MVRGLLVGRYGGGGGHGLYLTSLAMRVGLRCRAADATYPMVLDQRMVGSMGDRGGRVMWGGGGDGMGEEGRRGGLK